MMKHTFFLVALLLLWGCTANDPSPATEHPFQQRYGIRYQGYVGEKAMVVSAHALASHVGRDVLLQGGNAVDAAVAVHFALAVVLPAAGNIGGGGFAVYRDASGAVYSLDFRETAPGLAHRDMYLDETGEIIPRSSLDGHSAAGVPGMVDGMVRLHDSLGSMSWNRLLQPAIDMAAIGFPVTAMQADRLNALQDRLLAVNTHSDIPFLRLHWHAGDTLVQPQLASTLRRIQQLKRAGFYEGITADLLVQEMKNGGGLITHQDLSKYRSQWRAPLTFRHKEFTLHSMGLPSSGGILLRQLLFFLNEFPLTEWGWNSARTVHLLTEAERLAYADRAKWLGDADFVEVPVAQLTDTEYLQGRLALLDTAHATPSLSIQAGNPMHPESEETTHFSIVDAFGNAIAITTTLNGSYGSGVVVQGAGFLLNNEMDDFSSKPGTPNLYGLMGSEANAIAPGKRMLSSMAPTIVEKDHKLFMVLGTPGGSTIPTSVLQVFLNVTAHGLSMQEAVNAGRVHHQWLPDVLYYEDTALDSTAILWLQQRGHTLQQRDNIGAVDAILVLPDGRLEGAADFRMDDAAAGY